LPRYVYIYNLVGGFNPSEKYARQLGFLFPTEWKNKIHVPNHQPVIIYMYIYTLWLFNIAMENGPSIDGLLGFTY